VLCPECGQETETLYEGACASCRAKKVVLIDAPEVLSIITCAHCGKLQEGSQWRDAGPGPEAVLMDRLHAAVRAHQEATGVHVEFDTMAQDARNLRVEVRAEGLVHGHPASAARTIQVRLSRAVCTECSRREGGYFEAILQVRGNPERPLKDATDLKVEVANAMDQLASEGREGAFFSKLEDARGGPDFYTGSQEVARVLARDLASRWGAEISESNKLVGRQDGVDLYRVTILLRLPPYARGDFVQADGLTCKILALDRKSIQLLDLDRWAVIRREPRRIRDLKVIASAEQEQQAVVVSRTRSLLQVLHPRTMATIDLTVPEDYTTSETVAVLDHDGRLWVVPETAYAKQ
jgi:nonsense-mediated mRNA decay protein 3